jgi:hypothetical protein
MPIQKVLVLGDNQTHATIPWLNVVCWLQNKAELYVMLEGLCQAPKAQATITGLRIVLCERIVHVVDMSEHLRSADNKVLYTEGGGQSYTESSQLRLLSIDGQFAEYSETSISISHQAQSFGSIDIHFWHPIDCSLDDDRRRARFFRIGVLVGFRYSSETLLPMRKTFTIYFSKFGHGGEVIGGGEIATIKEWFLKIIAPHKWAFCDEVPPPTDRRPVAKAKGMRLYFTDLIGREQLDHLLPEEADGRYSVNTVFFYHPTGIPATIPAPRGEEPIFSGAITNPLTNKIYLSVALLLGIIGVIIGLIALFQR